MRVWVTRDETRDGALSTALRRAGLEVVLAPVIERRVVDDCSDVIGALGREDWLVLTSPYAVEAVAERPGRVPRVAVVGEASRRAAAARAFRVERVSSGSDAASLFAALRASVDRGRVCYPRSSRAAVPEAWEGVELVSPVLYETQRRDFDRGVIGRVDVAAVVSASAVEAVGRVELRFASLGPATSAALRRMGITPWVEAPDRSFASLAMAIADQSHSSRQDRA